MWGIGLVVEASARLTLADLLPTGTFLAVSPFITVTVIGGLFAFTVVYTKRNAGLVGGGGRPDGARRSDRNCGRRSFGGRVDGGGAATADGRRARPSLTGPLGGSGTPFGSLGGPRRPTASAIEGSTMADEVLRERRGHVEILTINRPEARNAINGAVSRAMSGVMDELAEDPECWVVVVTGSGDKAFSAGMDLKAFSSGEGGDIMDASGGFGGLTQRDFPKPIIAAVNGSALAGGFEIMLSCDLVVAAEHATFGIPEAKRGLIAGAGGSSACPSGCPSPSPSRWR